MQFGVFLPSYWRDYGDHSVRSAVEETARAAEALGYVSLWANDHVIAPVRHPGVGYIIEPLITLASLIHLVPRLQLGVSVLVLPQRNAILVAKQVAALDLLSGGRFILGIGAGWLEEEFRFLNADFERRGAHADEAIQVMRTLWREHPASHEGQFYRFSDAVFFPKPGRGGPPLWIGGNTPPAIRRAARFGDAWVPFGIGLEDFAEGASGLRSWTEGREGPLIAAHLRIFIGTPGPSVKPHIAGSADEVRARLDQYRQAGLQYLICDFEADSVDDLLRQMRVMAEEIAPHFAS